MLCCDLKEYHDYLTLHETCCTVLSVSVIFIENIGKLEKYFPPYFGAYIHCIIELDDCH